MPPRAKVKSPPKPLGRPSAYSDQLAQEICDRLAEGESLRKICRSEDMPAGATVARWLSMKNAFREQYAIACAVRTDLLFDEILEIADDTSDDRIEKRDEAGNVVGCRENGEAIRRSQLRVDARKWTVARLAPKKYGDRVTNVLEGGDKPVEVAAVTAERRKAALALLLSRK